MSAMNAFTSVRPRGPDSDIPAKPPKRTVKGTNPMPPRALDRLGRPTVDMGARTKGSITIESREASQASVAKRQRISKAGTK